MTATERGKFFDEALDDDRARNPAASYPFLCHLGRYTGGTYSYPPDGPSCLTLVGNLDHGHTSSIYLSSWLSEVAVLEQMYMCTDATS